MEPIETRIEESKGASFSSGKFKIKVKKVKGKKPSIIVYEDGTDPYSSGKAIDSDTLYHHYIINKAAYDFVNEDF